jgi:hypothetical protein
MIIIVVKQIQLAQAADDLTFCSILLTASIDDEKADVI